MKYEHTMEHSLLLLYFYYKGSYVQKLDTLLLDAYLQTTKKALEKFRELFTILKDLL